MVESLIKTMTEDIGSIVQGLESMFISMQSGFIVFFVGMMILGLIGVITYILKKTIEVSAW